MRKFFVFVVTLVCLLVMGGVVYRVWAQTPAPQTVTKTVEERVKATIVTHLGVPPDQVRTGARFKEDLKADDLDMAELTMAYETEFGIEIPDADTEGFVRVSDVVRYIMRKAK